MEAVAIEYHPQSYADARGRVFFREGRLFRQIHPQWADFYTKFISSNSFHSLVRDGLLIDTWIADEGHHHAGLVLEHKLLGVASFPYEWCFAAFKDCALLILDLQARLFQNGFSICDGHPFNVMFDRCRPVFVDFGSIIYADSPGTSWSALHEFKVNVLNPLRLMAQGHAKIARAIMYRDQDVTDEEAELLLARQHVPAREKNRQLIWNVLLNPRSQDSEVQSDSTLQTICSLRQAIEELQYPAVATEWSSYYEDEFLPLNLEHYDRPKMQSVKDVLVKYKPRNVLDVASNRGWFAQLAARLGAQVIAFDIDEVSINHCYEDCKMTGANVQPLVMNMTNPSPGIGIMNKGFPRAFDRFRSDIVLALAIVHHLVFTSQLRFEQIVGTLNELTKSVLLVEFVPKEDIHISPRWTSEREWYSLENFKSELKKYFRSIVEMQSDPSPRVLLLCER